MSSTSDRGHEAADAAAFRTTHWSVVLSAAQKDCDGSPEALAKLCEVYRYPLYAYIRRRGHDPHQAEDLTQEFFARLLEKDFLAGVTREGGKFRSFLLTLLKRFLANEWARSQTQKRGGGARILSLNTEDPEVLYAIEPVDHLSPDVLFERRWATTLLNRVVSQLESEYKDWRKAELFERLQIFLCSAERETPYKELGLQLGLSEGAIKQAVRRMRKRYRELVREEIARTVAGPEEIEEEIQHLISVLAG